jgi:hypothetical protein
MIVIDPHVPSAPIPDAREPPSTKRDPSSVETSISFEDEEHPIPEWSGSVERRITASSEISVTALFEIVTGAFDSIVTRERIIVRSEFVTETELISDVPVIVNRDA